MLLPQRIHVLFPSNWPSLRTRMTVSYVAVTLGSVLSFILLGTLARSALVTLFSGATTPPSSFSTAVQRQAQSYALMAALQARGAALDPHTTFIPGQAYTVALAYQDKNSPGWSLDVFAPYITTTAPDPTSVALALLIAPSGRLMASSYPSRYPRGMVVSALTSEQTRAIDQALAGQASRGTEHLPSVTLEYTAEPVWSDTHQPIGAIFLQVPEPESEAAGFVSAVWNSLSDNIVLLVLMTPVGVFFGWITARGLVGRVRQLATATSRFAAGDYTQRVTSNYQDEIGQLERQFNHMAEQLVENIARQQQLAEQNARLQERSRISRELHDAVSQDLFSLRMLADGLQEAASTGSTPADLRPHIALLEQTTGNMTREMRALLLELRPTELENLGLVGALQKLAQAYSTRLGITVSTDVQPLLLDVTSEHALLRIAQEALANAARHASATLISLSLVGDDGMARLTITDNGTGFAAHNGVGNHGLGLRIMRERVQELHGAFDLRTAPGNGTCIAIALPSGERQ